jgi:hypothetical protein
MMYEGATSVVQVNGHLSSPMQIKCGVRKGCPLSMILFALCLDPLLRYLDGRLLGLRVHRSQTNSTVVAYADDVSILVTSPEDVQIISEAIICYEKAISVALNVAKSRALVVNSWNTALDILGIPYCEEITTLRVTLRKTIRTSAIASWTGLTLLIRTQAQQAYSRDLNLAQRIMYAQVTCLQNYGTQRKYYSPHVSASGKSYLPHRGTFGCVPYFLYRYPLCRDARRMEDGV